MTDITIPPEVVKQAKAMFLFHQKEGTEVNAAWADILNAALNAWPGMYRYPGTKIVLPLPQETSDE